MLMNIILMLLLSFIFFGCTCCEHSHRSQEPFEFEKQ